jgi:hypothetical protein
MALVRCSRVLYAPNGAPRTWERGVGSGVLVVEANESAAMLSMIAMRSQAIGSTSRSMRAWVVRATSGTRIRQTCVPVDFSVVDPAPGHPADQRAPRGAVNMRRAVLGRGRVPAATRKRNRASVRSKTSSSPNPRLSAHRLGASGSGRCRTLAERGRASGSTNHQPSRCPSCDRPGLLHSRSHEPAATSRAGQAQGLAPALRRRRPAEAAVPIF